MSLTTTDNIAFLDNHRYPAQAAELTPEAVTNLSLTQVAQLTGSDLTWTAGQDAIKQGFYAKAAVASQQA